jgi:hypothetical protein
MYIYMSNNSNRAWGDTNQKLEFTVKNKLVLAATVVERVECVLRIWH